MSSNDTIVTHSDPIWRSRSDFIIQAPLGKEWSPKKWEQLFVRQIDNTKFEICCIPFFMYGVSLGDLVLTRSSDQWEWVFDSIHQRSGRFVFRVWVGGFANPPLDLVSQLERRGALIERASAHLFAVDAASEPSAKDIANYLSAHADAERLAFENGSP